MILFNEKYKIKDLNDEVAKSYYNKASDYSVYHLITTIFLDTLL